MPLAVETATRTLMMSIGTVIIRPIPTFSTPNRHEEGARYFAVSLQSLKTNAEIRQWTNKFNTCLVGLQLDTEKDVAKSSRFKRVLASKGKPYWATYSWERVTVIHKEWELCCVFTILISSTIMWVQSFMHSYQIWDDNARFKTELFKLLIFEYSWLSTVMEIVGPLLLL